MSDAHDFTDFTTAMAFADIEPELLEAMQDASISATAAIATMAKELAELSEVYAPAMTAGSYLSESAGDWTTLQRLASTIETGSLVECLTSACKPRRRRGRPIKISDERKQRAQALRGKGGSLGDAARILYNTLTPTRQQKSNASTILRVFRLKVK